MSARTSALGIRPLDRSVGMLSGVIWLAHLLTMISVSRALGMNVDMGATFARVLASASGIAITLVMYGLLRNLQATQPWRPFLLAAALSVPACALQTFLNEFAFHELALSYRMDPGKWLNYAEMSFTYMFFFWVFIAWSALYASAASAIAVAQRDGELAAARNSAQEAQLMALRLQISPHFLFNTLNTLSGLTALGRRDDSERIIQNLSDFLRYSLTTAPEHLVRLEMELQVQLKYLEIERARFPDRLRVRVAVPPMCLDAMVPSLILLPLVENAIKHGLDVTEGQVEVAITACHKDGSLIVSVAHDGGVFPPNPRGGLRIGLRNVRERLAAAFGAEGRLESGATNDGWNTTLSIPWTER